MPFNSDAADKKDPGNYFLGAGRSTLSAIPELFGVEPSYEVDSFRASHPVTGFATQLLGTAVPYAGWFKATKAVTAADAAINAIGDLEKAPILSRAAQEVARYAPFEAGRIGIASGVNNQPLGKELGESALNLGLMGAFGGAGGAFEAAGTRAAGDSVAPFAEHVDVSAPVQIQMRQLQEAVSRGEVKDPSAATNWIANRANDVRYEEPGTAYRYLGQLEGEEPARDVSRSLERAFFKPDVYSEASSAGKSSVVRTFSNTSKGFANTTDWQQAARDFDLPDAFPMYGQYFRHIDTLTDKAAQNLLGRAGKLTQAGDWFIGREANDGLWVMLKRLGEDTKGRAGDQWVALKTDQPAAFAKDFRPWNDTLARAQAWLPELNVPADAGGGIFQYGRRLTEQLPMEDYTLGQKQGGFQKFLGQSTGELGKRLEDATTYLATPAINQTVRNARANYVTKMAQLIYDHTDQLVNDVMQGERPRNIKGLFSAAMGGVERELGQGLQGLINGMSKDQLGQFAEQWRRGATPEQLDAAFASGEIDKPVRDLYQKLEDTVTGFYTSAGQTAKILGDNEFSTLAGHGGLSRTWEGSVYIPVSDEGGNVVGLATGFNRNGALKRAEFIKSQLEKEGKSGLRIGSTWDSTATEAVPRELRIAQSTPGFVQERKGIRGFKWDFGENPTSEELAKAIRGSINDRAKGEAGLAIRTLFQPEVDKLGLEDPTMYKVVTDRLNAMAGKADDVTKKINQIIDPVLGPVMGGNSASKVVNALNQSNWHLSLGALNFAFPVVNVVGTLQTILPELAFVMSGAPERLSGYYTPQLVKAASGKMSWFHSLDPIKVMTRAMGQFAKPDADLLQAMHKAINDGTIDPKFLEDYVGQNSKQVGRFKDVLTGKEPFTNWIKAVSEWMPNVSERLSRTMAFTTGYDVAKNVMGLEGDKAYLFAKQFTDRTMYRYATADRAAIFTNPAGRLFGNMKNWISHYLSNMLVYSGEAMHGNIAPLAWQMASTAGLGGASAVPFLPTIANAFLGQSEDKNLMNWTYKAMGQKAGDAAYFGLPAVMGVSLSSQTAAPTRDATMLFSLAHMQRMQAAAGAIGSAIDRYKATGDHPGRDPAVLGQLIHAMAPKMIYRGLQAYDNPGIKNLTTGYPIVDQVNPWNKVLFSLGFQPNEIERGYALFDQMLKDETEKNNLTHAFGRAMGDALTAGDDKEIEALVRRAMVEGVDISSVMGAAQGRMSMGDKDLIERNFTDAQRQAYSAVLGDEE